MFTPTDHVKVFRTVQYSSRKKEANMKDCSTAILIQNIAEEQNQASFNELYKRFEQPAYNLAYQVTRNREMAMEAVQEAMLRIWISAKQFNKEMNPRGWIFRIVVREGIRITRITRADKMRRAKKAVTLQAEQEPQRGAVEQREEFAALRKGVEALPEMSRRLLTLYYGAGMSQREIAESENISQRSVSNKLEESIKLLRSKLTRMGIASATFPLGGDTLSEPLLSMYAVPEALKSNVMLKLDVHIQLSRAPVSRFLVPGILLGSLALAVMVFVYNQGHIDALLVKEQTSKTLQKQPILSLKTKELYYAEWTFENGPPNDIDLKQGAEWDWEVENDGYPPVVKMSSRMISMLLLPQKRAQRPIVITVDVYQNEKGTATFHPVLGTQSGLAACSEKFNTLKQKSKSQATVHPVFRYKAYIYGQYIFVGYDQKILRAIRYESKQPGDRICLIVKNWKISRIVMEEVEQNSWPTVIRDPEKQYQNLKGKMHAHPAFQFSSKSIE